MLWVERVIDAAGRLDDALVWTVELNSPDAEAALARARPAPAELADAAVIENPDRSAIRLARRRLLRALAAEALTAHPDQVVIERTASGGLRVTSPEPLFASTAARGGWAALGLARARIGVDIETLPPELPPPLDLLHPNEQAALSALPSERCGKAFLRLWTAKEAYAKATALSLDSVLPAVEVRDRGRRIQIAGPQPARCAEVRELPGAVAAAVIL